MGTKLIVGPGRMSFVHILEPQKNDQGKDSYNMAFLLPPSIDTKPILAALTDEMNKGFGADRAKWPKTARKPEDVIKPCAGSDHHDAPEFAGWSYFNCGSYEQPGVVNALVEDVELDKTKNPKAGREVYSGRWARISVNAYSYQTGKKGVTLGLNNIQLLKHDTPLSGRARPQNEFDSYAEELEGAESGDWN
jgi:hypothetical protein